MPLNSNDPAHVLAIVLQTFLKLSFLSIKQITEENQQHSAIELAHFCLN